MENDESNKERQDNNRLVLSIIRKVKTTLNPEEKPPPPSSEPPLIDPFLEEMYEFIKSTVPKNNYEQNIRARKLIQQFEAYQDLVMNKRLRSKKTMEKILRENMTQFLRDRQG